VPQPRYPFSKVYDSLDGNVEISGYGKVVQSRIGIRNNKPKILREKTAQLRVSIPQRFLPQGEHQLIRSLYLMLTQRHLQENSTHERPEKKGPTDRSKKATSLDISINPIKRNRAKYPVLTPPQYPNVFAARVMPLGLNLPICQHIGRGETPRPWAGSYRGTTSFFAAFRERRRISARFFSQMLRWAKSSALWAMRRGGGSTFFARLAPARDPEFARAFSRFDLQIIEEHCTRSRGKLPGIPWRTDRSPFRNSAYLPN